MKQKLMLASECTLPQIRSDELNKLQKISREFNSQVDEIVATMRKLKKDSAVLSGVCTILNDAIIRINHLGVITYLNPSAEKLFKGSKQDFVGFSLSKLCGIDAYHVINEIQREGKMQIKMKDKEDRKFEASISVTKIEHEDNTREYVFIIRDISDILKMKSALVDSDTKFEVLSKALDEANDVILITDKDNHIIFANRSFTMHTGYTYKDALGKNPNFYASGKTSKETYDRMWDSLKAGRIWQGMLSNTSKYGQELLDNTLIIPVVQSGQKEPTYYIAVKRYYETELE